MIYVGDAGEKHLLYDIEYLKGLGRNFRFELPFRLNYRPAALSRQANRQGLFIGGSRLGLTVPGALSGLFRASNLSRC